MTRKPSLITRFCCQVEPCRSGLETGWVNSWEQSCRQKIIVQTSLNFKVPNYLLPLKSVTKDSSAFKSQSATENGCVLCVEDYLKVGSIYNAYYQNNHDYHTYHLEEKQDWILYPLMGLPSRGTRSPLEDLLFLNQREKKDREITLILSLPPLSRSLKILLKFHFSFQQDAI